MSDQAPAAAKPANKKNVFWIYPLAAVPVKGEADMYEPALLMGQRKGRKGLFIHLPCGGQRVPVDSPALSETEACLGAQKGLKRETGLDLPIENFRLFWTDGKGESDWEPGATTYHIIADFGKRAKLPATGEPRMAEGPAPGLINGGDWIRFKEFVVLKTPLKHVDEAASQLVTHRNIPLRSTIAYAIGAFLSHYVLAYYGPQRDNNLQRLQSAAEGYVLRRNAGAPAP